MKLVRMDNYIRNNQPLPGLATQEFEVERKVISRKNSSDVIEISPKAREAFLARKQEEDAKRDAVHVRWLFDNADAIAGRKPASEKISPSLEMAMRTGSYDFEVGARFMADLLTG